MIQATKLPSEAETSAITTALNELATFDPSIVELVGRDVSFLPREAYFDLLGQSDIVLCLYDAKVYRARSSGIMTESLAAGKPVIVPAGTWMSRQLPFGCGESFIDMPSLVAAVRKVADDYATYHANVQKQRVAWLNKHSPAALLQCLIASERREKQAA